MNRNNSLLVFCQLDLLLKIRLEAANWSVIINRLAHFSQKMSPDTLYYIHAKNKIESIISEGLLTKSSSFDIDLSIEHECLDLNPIDGKITQCSHLLKEMFTKEVQLTCKDLLYKLTFTNLGSATDFCMVVYSGTNILRDDCILVDFNTNSDGQNHPNAIYYTHLFFRDHDVDDDIIFIGIKLRMVGDVIDRYENFALIYNNNPQNRCCFKYIIIDPSLSIYSNHIVICTLIRNKKKLLCISHQDKRNGDEHGEHDYLKEVDINLNIYDIVSGAQIARITINESVPNSISSNRVLLLANIGKYFVCAKDGDHDNTVTFIWINSDTWVIENTVTLSINFNDVVGLRLIGIHDYLSAMVVSSRVSSEIVSSGNPNESVEIREKYSAAVYYF